MQITMENQSRCLLRSIQTDAARTMCFRLSGLLAECGR